jgi:hypothetical protein
VLVQFHAFTISALDGTNVKFHALVVLSPGKGPLVLLGGPYSWYGRFGEKPLTPAGKRTTIPRFFFLLPDHYIVSALYELMTVLLTYLITYLLNYLLTYLLNYLLTYLLTHSLTYSLTHSLHETESLRK